MMLEINKVHNMDCIEGLKLMPNESVHMCVTSPPYWGLRDYGVDGQIGLEKTPEEYLSRMVSVFREVRRVLRKDGTIWVNMGDCYWGGKGQSSQAWSMTHKNRKTLQKAHHHICSKGNTRPTDMKSDIFKPKDLIGMPWRLAFALQSDGWYLRSDIIWSKPNPMPESVEDRPTKAHEYVFLLAKSQKYYYDADAISEVCVTSNDDKSNHSFGTVGGKVEKTPGKIRKESGENWDNKGRRNKRDVWAVPTKSYPGSHFATFPEELIEPCILAGCPIAGVVIDPFMGSGTTGSVALRLKRQFIGFELNHEYVRLANERIYSGCKTLDSFLKETGEKVTTDA